jgi:hypothetical protein
MSVQLNWTGAEYTTPDHSLNYGTTISSPATLLSGMVTNQYYFQEAGGDIDVVFISAESFLISMFKSFTNQKLMQQFVVRMTSVGGQNKLRFVHRNLATTFTMEQSLRACGVDVTVSDDWSSTNLASINQALAPYFISVWKAP